MTTLQPTLQPTPPNPWQAAPLFVFTVLLLLALIAGCDGPVQSDTEDVPADTVQACEFRPPGCKITEEDWGFE